jgi:hypothetical protein
MRMMKKMIYDMTEAKSTANELNQSHKQFMFQQLRLTV